MGETVSGVCGAGGIDNNALFSPWGVALGDMVQLEIVPRWVADLVEMDQDDAHKHAQFCLEQTLSSCIPQNHCQDLSVALAGARPTVKRLFAKCQEFMSLRSTLSAKHISQLLALPCC